MMISTTIALVVAWRVLDKIAQENPELRDEIRRMREKIVGGSVMLTMFAFIAWRMLS